MGDSIVLDFATPIAGAMVTVINSGPEEIEVTFRKGGKQNEFHAKCSNGTAQVRVGGDD